jgi:hypothetical protein
MMKYVSIDIDFFNDTDDFDVEAYLNEIFSKAKECKIPCVAVMNHQQLIPFVNKSAARHLINLDEHSDLADTPVTTLNCGTWVNYVTWRNRGMYSWIHAGSVDQGECSEGEHVVFRTTRKTGRNCDWKKAIHLEVETPPSMRELLAECFGIGFCLSPSYRNSCLEPVFKRIVKRHKLPYLSGKRNEHFSIQKTPRIVKD